jgi:hypothetical protein
MARKSQKLRLSQALDLKAAYEENSLTSARAYRFLCDATARMGRGKYPTKRQRDWLDALIDEGVPKSACKDLELLAEVDAALRGWAGWSERSWELGVLTDFRQRLWAGWNFSEKQSALLEKLVLRYEDDAAGVNVFTPTEEQRKDLEALCRLYRGYAPLWRSERPAVATAVDRVKRFLAGDIGFDDRPWTIEEYHWNKLNKAMGSRLKTIKSPRFSSGSLGFATPRVLGLPRPISSQTEIWKWSKRTAVITALTDAYVGDEGHVVNDWLAPSGAIITLSAGTPSKRREKIPSFVGA